MAYQTGLKYGYLNTNFYLGLQGFNYFLLGFPGFYYSNP